MEALGAAPVDGRAAWDAAGCPVGRAALALDVVVGRAVLAFAERFTLFVLFERSTLTFILLYWGAFTVVLGA